MSEDAAERRPPAARYRHDVPQLGPGVIARPRLLSVLRGRFERRLTVLTAGAGFGKTTLLAQAVVENRIDDQGIDAWLRVEPGDRDPSQLLAAMVRSLAATDMPAQGTVDEVLDAVWARAPLSVAFLLDDVHHLEGSPAGWATLQELLDRLPANGHLLLAGRSAPPVGIGRLLAEDAAAVLDEDDLTFTDDELRTFGSSHSLAPELIAELPPWPALAVLTSVVGHGAPTDYLWQEVLSALPDDRRILLARASTFSVIDDLVVEALAPEGGWTAERLLEGLPLVWADESGRHWLHAMWTDALSSELEPTERHRALVAGSTALIEAGAYRRAAEAAAAAGDVDLIDEAIRRFAVRPITSANAPDVAALLELLPPALRLTPVGTFLHAAQYRATSARQAATLFERVITDSQAAGDPELEAIAWWRLVQLEYLDRPDELRVQPRMEELAALGVPLGASTPAFVRSVEAQRAGRVDEAIAAIGSFDLEDPDQRLDAEGWRLIDLGRPEAVGGSVEHLIDGDGVDLIGAQGVWLRGEIDPESAWAIGASFPDLAGRRGVAHEQSSIRSVVALVAMAAGELDAAGDLARAAQAPAEIIGAQATLLARIAHAQVLLATESEPAAMAILEEVLTEHPLRRWPSRGHLYGLAAIRALCPSAAMLDDCALGPSMRVAVDAGKAVAVLRSDGDLGASADLPWDAVDLLRAYVPVPLLVEAAVAASLGGRSEAEHLLYMLPHRRRFLRRIADRADGAVSAHAAAFLGSMPVRPSYELRLRSFGDLTIERSDGALIDGEWSSRERVRQLLALLILRRRIARTEVTATMWPDHSPGKASSNLRTNLRHLQHALQPDRDADATTWFVRIEGQELVLAGEDEGLHLDVDAFDRHVIAAIRAEEAGAPSAALEAHRAALTCYRGDFLPDCDLPDADLERLRLRSLAHASQCRAGELILARGEPEEAMSIAVEAQRLDPISERAHRLSIRSHLAIGSLSVARQAAQLLLDALDDAGLAAEEETLSLLRRLQIHAA